MLTNKGNPNSSFRQVDGRVHTTGIPRTHDWYANLRRNPHFTFHLKESVHADCPARTRFITDVDERRQILSAPEMGWYQRKVASVEKLVVGSPLVEVLFDRRVSDDLAATF